jgi:hypothetical protein
MKPLRWVAASLLWIVGGLLGLLGVLLTATLILAPIGIPLLMTARRLFGTSGRLVVPRAVRHPLDELDRAGSDAAADLKRTVRKKGRRGGKDVRKRAAKLGKRVRDRTPGS